MKGLDEFLNIFGDITVLQVVELILAIVFLWGIYKQVKKHFDGKAKEALEKAEIEKVNYAMSAVYVPAGDNEIVFVYKTPWLDSAIALTAAGWAVYCMYIYFTYKKKK